MRIYFRSFSFFYLQMSFWQFSQKTQIFGQMRFSMMPGHIFHTVICSRKPFKMASFLKILGSWIRLKVTCLDTDAGDMAWGLTFLETMKDSIGIWEGSVPHTDGKSLRENAVARRMSACLWWIVHCRIVWIVPGFKEKYSHESSTCVCIWYLWTHASPPNSAMSPVKWSILPTLVMLTWLLSKCTKLSEWCNFCSIHRQHISKAMSLKCAKLECYFASPSCFLDLTHLWLYDL